ncbi:MAG: caspase family protein [Lacibacter sp.]
MTRKVLLISLWLLALSFPTRSQTCLSGNCSSGFGKFQYENGDIYEGEFYDDKREGFGVYFWKSGEKFIGESLQNAFNGFGVMLFPDGTKYIGDFKNGQFDGEGEIIYPGNVVRRGIFEKGKFLGKISYYNNPIGTVGCLNGDCENGYGMKYYASNDRYFGYFKNGKRHGYGAYYWEDGTRWVGEFDQNMLTGYGTYFFISGEKYVGFFSDSKRNGWGINYNPTTGTKQIGFWENNVLVTPKSALKTPDGQGTGCISGDCKNGYGVYVYNSGYYEGNFKNGYRDGFGKYYFDIGDYYVGTFRENKFNGKGTYFYTNGERYLGEWKDQRHHGYGQLFRSDGLPEEGYWNEGKYQGKDQKPPGYEVWVKNNYNNTGAGTSVATNTNSKPTATTPPTGTKPTAGTTGTGSGSGSGNKPTTPPANTGNKPGGNTTAATNNNKPNNQQPAGNNSGFSLVEKEYVKKGLALVIGNAKYRYITKLNNPANDVLAVSNQLMANGFDVITLYDGDREAMINAFMQFGERLQGYEVGLFYYSGHGVKYGSENYMVPVSANIRTPEDIALTCLGLSNILSRMGKAFTKLNIVIVDACRTPFKDGRGSNDEFDPEPTLNSKILPDETGIYFATSDGTPASDGLPGTNGIYTSELVKYLKYMCQENVNIEDIFKRVLREVKNKSNKVQVPEAKSSITKNFYYQCKN